jgi:hypothetical protein
MSQERLRIGKIREVLRLKAEGLSKRRIAASLGISATAVVECLQRVRRARLSWPLPDGLDDAALATHDHVARADTCLFGEVGYGRGVRTERGTNRGADCDR